MPLSRLAARHRTLALVYTSGTRLLNAIAVPLGHTRVRVLAQRENWDTRTDPITNHEVVQVRIDGSFDGGETWQFLFGFGAQGGAPVILGVGVPGESWGRGRLPQSENPARMVRASVQTLSAIRTLLKLETD